MVANNKDDINKSIRELCDAVLLLEDRDEVLNFLKDLCTPGELSSLAERWKVCQMLDSGELSYRDIHAITGVSMVTISRVARFLKDEPYQGYINIINKIREKNQK